MKGAPFGGALVKALDAALPLHDGPAGEAVLGGSFEVALEVYLAVAKEAEGTSLARLTQDWKPP